MANEKLLTFPCDFPLKVVGKKSEDFRETVLEIISLHIEGTHPVTERPSKDNNFIALTVLLRVDSQEQLDNIYRALSSHELVLMVL